MEPDHRALHEETRRHFDVVAEQMRADVRRMAEGLGAFRDRVDRLEQNLREEILRAQRELSAMIKFSYAELDRKIQGLERRQEETEERLRRLEATR